MVPVVEASAAVAAVDVPGVLGHETAGGEGGEAIEMANRVKNDN